MASSAAVTKGVFVVAAKRTPFGKFGGSLQHLTATQLGVIASQAALAQANIPAEWMESCIFGNVLQSAPDAPYLARHVALRSGALETTPALTVNRLCGSGFESVVLGAQHIQLGLANLVVCGGAENMSQAPLHACPGHSLRFGNRGKGVPLGQGLRFTDALTDALTDAYIRKPMGMTAEALGLMYKVTREDCDAYALQSQHRWAAAQQSGVFEAELAPVPLNPPNTKDQKRKLKEQQQQQQKQQAAASSSTATPPIPIPPDVLTQDEHPRGYAATLEHMAQLSPVFAREGGTLVTAANASGIGDGAGCIVLASEELVRNNHQHLTPLARIVSYATTGCDPEMMGLGPVMAILQSLLKAGDWTLQNDIDRIEINEAFAAQTLACVRDLQIDDADVMLTKVNIHGGAIAMGHPLGASGSRIMAHLVHAFQQDASVHKSVGAACIGGGQGIAIVLERV